MQLVHIEADKCMQEPAGYKNSLRNQLHSGTARFYSLEERSGIVCPKCYTQLNVRTFD